MGDGTGFGRESRARFTFAGSTVELSRAAPLIDDEQVLLHGVGRNHARWRLPRPVLLRLTPPRLVALSHHAFAADRILELPRAAVCDVDVHRGVVQVVWQRAAGVTATLRVGPWTGPNRLDRALPGPDELGQLLHEWLLSG